MFINRTVRNTFCIGCGMCGISFGASVLSAASINKPQTYIRKTFSGTISSTEDIEDLEFSKGCRFYFYGKGLVDVNKFRSAREFKFAQDRTKMYKKVQDQINNCTKDRTLYIDPTVP